MQRSVNLCLAQQRWIIMTIVKYPNKNCSVILVVAETNNFVKSTLNHASTYFPECLVLEMNLFSTALAIYAGTMP